jgi:ATP:ADP antiporter, AAA family
LLYVHLSLRGIMLLKILRALWGDFSNEEIKKFGLLAAILFLIIGCYWMLRTMKDATFDLLVGYEWQPFAKLVSVCVVGFAVVLYSKLVDLMKEHLLFYVICIFYGVSTLVIAYFLSNPNVLVQSNSFWGEMFSWIPGKTLGWIVYVFIESFGSILLTLFWAFVANYTTAESAKRGYGMIISCAQLGTVAGPWFVIQYSSTMGLPILFYFGGVLIFIIPTLVTLYTTMIPTEKNIELNEKSKTGFLEGLRLLVSHKYLMGLFIVATSYEVIATIIDFQMGICIKNAYPSHLDGGAAFAWFKAWNGMAVGLLSFTFALLGTSFFMRKFGLKFCLVSFPVTIGLIVIMIFSYSAYGFNQYQLMWGFFVALLIIKSLNYSLNNPSKEVMYIPTSKDVKFKTKGWIDAFGNRTTKGIGSIITGMSGGCLPTLLLTGSVISVGIVIFWVFIASFVGTTFESLQKNKKIIK